MTRTDWLIAGYLAFVTAFIAARGGVGSGTGWLILAHALFVVLLIGFAGLGTEERVGRMLHALYPIILLAALYAEIGILSAARTPASIYAHDAVVQGWEASLFGSQISYEWIRRAPSVFWSGLLHLAYVSYYPIVVLGPVILWFTGRRDGARHVIFTTMVAFVACYTCFVLYPVAGPNYAFPHPTGPVREVWSARLIYGILENGSSMGAAFPSSHVAATVAAVAATWKAWRPLAVAFVLPAALLVVGTVYCQMHYGVDVLAGLVVAAGAWAVGRS